MVEYPDAAEVTEGQASMEVVGGRLYKFGGHDGESYVGEGLHGWMSAACDSTRRAGPRHCRAGGRGRKSHIRRVKDLKRGAKRAWRVLRRDRGESISWRLEVSGTDVAADKG